MRFFASLRMTVWIFGTASEAAKPKDLFLMLFERNKEERRDSSLCLE
jgi:hypothetical protein